MMSMVRQLLLQAFMALGTLILAGRALKRLIYLPLRWFSSKTKNKVDDILVEDLRHDFGLPKEGE